MSNIKMKIMKIKLSILVLFMALLMCNSYETFGQITEQVELTEQERADYQALINRIETFEKETLKQKIEVINVQQQEGEISEEEAQKLKMRASEIAVKNINDLKTIVDAYVMYLDRNNYPISDFSEIDFDELEVDIPSEDLEVLFEVLDALGGVFEDLQLSDHDEYAAVLSKRKEVEEKRQALIDAREELKMLRKKQYAKRNIEITNLPETQDTTIVEQENLIDLEEKEEVDPTKVRGSRSSDALVLAIGFNNMLSSGTSLNDSGIRFGGSRSFEIGYARETRIFKNVSWLSVKYGFSFQFNGLKPEGNNIFAANGNQTTIEEFDFNLRKNKFRMDNLIFPLHLQFGSKGIRTNSKGNRYYSDHNFKVGVGGFAGINLLNTNKLKYTNADGQRIKQRIRDDFNTTNLLYGLSAYVGWDDFSFYAQYNLNPMFTDNAVDTHNIQLGIRFDLD